MCGIIGYKGQRNGNEVRLKGLKSLGYRGYDSWGIASLNNNKISIINEVGNIGEISLKDQHLEKKTISLGHPR